MEHGSNFRRGVATHGNVGGSERVEDLEFQLIPGTAFGKRLQERERAFEILHGLVQRTSRHCLHAGEPQIFDGLCLIGAA